MSELRFFNLKKMAFYKEADGDSGYEVARLIRPEKVDDIDIQETENTLPRKYNVTLRGSGMVDKKFYNVIFIGDHFDILNVAPIDINPLL